MAEYQYPLEIQQLQEMIDEGLEVKEMDLRDLLITGIIELKKMNYHLSILSDEEIDDIDVE